MVQGSIGSQDSDERHATLLNNAAAIRSLCAAVEGTLGPKGLDTMLVGQQGEVMITNDGVSILNQIDVSHPAARLMIQVAQAQQDQVGDGTTTAAVLAGAIVQEGVAQVVKGVPAAKVASGIETAIRLAEQSLAARARTIASLEDPMLMHVADVAARGNVSIARLIMQAAHSIGEARLQDSSYQLSEAVTRLQQPQHELWPGLLINKKPLNPYAVSNKEQRGVCVLLDPLAPNDPSEEALTTESGFRAQLQAREQFVQQLHKLQRLQIGLIVVDRAIDAGAEQFCSDHGMLLVQRLQRKELEKLCSYTAAIPIRRTALDKPLEQLQHAMGYAEEIRYDEKLGSIRLIGSSGQSMVTIGIGGTTQEMSNELTRIAKDAAAAVQAAVRGGYVPGGGAIEISLAAELERVRESTTGMEAFGVGATASALRKPLAQIVLNAGFNPLEKVEEVRAAQLEQQCDEIGIDCDTGAMMNMLDHHILDPALVKIHAIRAAGEVAAAIIRIHTIVKMKSAMKLDSD